MLLPESQDAEIIIKSLLSSFKNVCPASEVDEDFAFEFKALEAVLETVLHVLDDEYQVLEPKVQHTLDT
jgi:hypothetical protein